MGDQHGIQVIPLSEAHRADLLRWHTEFAGLPHGDALRRGVDNLASIHQFLNAAHHRWAILHAGELCGFASTCSYALNLIYLHPVLGRYRVNIAGQERRMGDLVLEILATLLIQEHPSGNEFEIYYPNARMEESIARMPRTWRAMKGAGHAVRILRVKA